MEVNYQYPFIAFKEHFLSEISKKNIKRIKFSEKRDTTTYIFNEFGLINTVIKTGLTTSSIYYRYTQDKAKKTIIVDKEILSKKRTERIVFELNDDLISVQVLSNKYYQFQESEDKIFNLVDSYNITLFENNIMIYQDYYSQPSYTLIDYNYRFLEKGHFNIILYGLESLINSNIIDYKSPKIRIIENNGYTSIEKVDKTYDMTHVPPKDLLTGHYIINVNSKKSIIKYSMKTDNIIYDIYYNDYNLPFEINEYNHKGEILSKLNITYEYY